LIGLAWEAEVGFEAPIPGKMAAFLNKNITFHLYSSIPFDLITAVNLV
jgi:hypothetical protein